MIGCPHPGIGGLNAAGSAQKEYDAYLQSTEAHIQQFQAKLVETYSTFVNGDMISHAADLGTAILDLVNKTDLLKHSLIAMAALKIGQSISTVGGAVAGTVTQMKTLGDAIQQVKGLPLDDDLRKEVLDKIGEATKSLTEKNLKLLLSQKNNRRTYTPCSRYSRKYNTCLLKCRHCSPCCLNRSGKSCECTF